MYMFWVQPLILYVCSSQCLPVCLQTLHATVFTYIRTCVFLSCSYLWHATYVRTHTSNISLSVCVERGRGWHTYFALMCRSDVTPTPCKLIAAYKCIQPSPHEGYSHIGWDSHTSVGQQRAWLQHLWWSGQPPHCGWPRGVCDKDPSGTASRDGREIEVRVGVVGG